MAMSSWGSNRSYSSERKIVAHSIGINPDQLAFARQTHSDRIQYVVSSGLAGECDSLITNHRSVILSIMVADCIPIFLYAPDSDAIGLVHVGWKGTANGVVVKTVKGMVRNFGSRPELIEVFMGPSIRPCCYEVQKDVASLFSDKFLESKRTNCFYLDLQKANCHQLRSCLIKAENIKADDRCTFCDSEGFHSYRREGHRASRMLCLISLT